MRMKHMEYLQKMEQTIDKFGVAVQGVFAEDNEPSFAYTIGNVLCGLPELIMFGLQLDTMKSILNSAVQRMREKGLIVEDHASVGELVKGYNVVFRFVQPELIDTYAGVLKVYCSWKELEFPPMYQIVWPDENHLFPWDPNFNQEIRRAQKALYLSGH